MFSRYSSNLHQRDNRSSLFETRSASPYDDAPSKKDYKASLLSQLESQNEDELTTMSEKVLMLKNLGSRMGDEIKNSQLNIDDLHSTMTNTQTRLKNTFKRMMVMAKKTGISWKLWLLFFFLVWLWFFFVWLS
ncbi:BA75_01699T0 [Komagataella pastoris]|uniref:BA75_01699T0 n=1 Tax=Komagataella pastoris TaxID=4922 RepID=A0A1B2J540_PICPA|nr:BA75_01699T0 [Komagataella pastoris]